MQFLQLSSAVFNPRPQPRSCAIVPDAIFAALAPFIGARAAAVEAARSLGG
jgi:hypothetical protein